MAILYCNQLFLQWQFWAPPPTLIPANISGYTIVGLYVAVITVASLSLNSLIRYCLTLNENVQINLMITYRNTSRIRELPSSELTFS